MTFLLYSCSYGHRSQPALKPVLTLALSWPTETYEVRRKGTRGGMWGAAVQSRYCGGASLGQSGNQNLDLHQAAAVSFPRVCKESPKLCSSKRGLLLGGGCLPCKRLFCTMGLASIFIAWIKIAAFAGRYCRPAPVSLLRPLGHQLLPSPAGLLEQLPAPSRAAAGATDRPQG